MVVTAEGGGETKGVMVSYHRLNFAVIFLKTFLLGKKRFYKVSKINLKVIKDANNDQEV